MNIHDSINKRIACSSSVVIILLIIITAPARLYRVVY